MVKSLCQDPSPQHPLAIRLVVSYTKAKVVVEHWDLMQD